MIEQVLIRRIRCDKCKTVGPTTQGDEVDLCNMALCHGWSVGENQDAQERWIDVCPVCIVSEFDSQKGEK